MVSRNYVREMYGMTALLRACGLYGSVSLTGVQVDQALKSVRSGEWMLVKDRPFKPIDLKENWYARMCAARSGSHFLLDVTSSVSGPGKWKITSIRIDRLFSGVAFAANFLVSRGDEGRAFLNSGKDYANTTRTVTQEWVPLDAEERYLAPSSAIHRYGAENKVRQIYIEADDAWDVSGASWHWRPVIANEEYEFNDK